MLAILADDLTGSLDSAAPFAARGMHVEVAVTVLAIDEALGKKPDVLSVNLGSRDIDADSARRRVEAALAALPAGTQFFKKIDSRLKGNIAVELDAMTFDAALVIPAIPAFGRVVRHGSVTGFGIDTPIPIRQKLGAKGSGFTIPDIARQSEIRDKLESAMEQSIGLLVGARGLAEALAERMSRKATASLAEIPAGPGLFVIGSRDPITLKQVEMLRKNADVRYLPAPNGRLAGATPENAALTLVQAVPGDQGATSEDVSRALAESVCPDLTSAASTLLFSGGTTAEALLEQMGIMRFRLLGECLPGLGLAYAQGHCIIAKSGGFGQPDTLRKIVQQLHRKAATAKH